MNYALTLLLFISSLGNFSSTHEFHVSKCLVEYKADKEEIQVSMNIFIDDLEVALQQLGVDSLYIGTEKESEKTDLYLIKYLNETFKVDVNQEENVAMQFIGKEISEDLSSIWCYLRIDAIDAIKKIHIKNSILLETYEDQKNITSIMGPEKKKSSFMSTRGDDEKTLSY